MESVQICPSCRTSKPLDHFVYNVKTKEYRKQCIACGMRDKKSKKSRDYAETRRLAAALNKVQ